VTLEHVTNKDESIGGKEIPWQVIINVMEPLQACNVSSGAHIAFSNSSNSTKNEQLFFSLPNNSMNDVYYL
jgi:hypothetical protein